MDKCDCRSWRANIVKKEAIGSPRHDLGTHRVQTYSECCNLAILSQLAQIALELAVTTRRSRCN